MYFLGLDVGTSAVKALVTDERGRIRSTAASPLALRTPKPGWAEQDPDDWWRGACKAIRAALGAARLRKGDVAGVGLSGQMHSSVFLDAKNHVIRPALLWCDGRTSAECREITARVGERNLAAWVANPALEGFTLPKVLWLRAHEPAAFGRLTKVVLPKDYVRYRLTGTLASEPSDASATLMYDTREGRWSERMMQAMELGMSLLPEVGESTEVLGRVSARSGAATGLAPGTPVVGGGADNACGAVGVSVVAPGEAVASWGTSGTVLSPTAMPLVDPVMRVHTFRHAVPRTFYLMGVMLTAGGAFAWHERELARELPKRGRARKLDREAARIAPGADGVTFLPYLQGERTPHRDASARGAFVGITLAHSRAHLTRAVVEGICFGMRDSLSILRELEIPIERILVTGAGAQSPFVRRMQADVYGLPVLRVDKEEGPAYGAALLAAVGVGAFADVPAACTTVKRLASEAPDLAAHAAYEAPYRRFRALYPALRSALAS
jgi:xylulokinase